MTEALELASRLRAGDRRALAKAITLVESARADDLEPARALMVALGRPRPNTMRIGVTGVPGAGKSTLIDALGLAAIADGRRVAVLAIDPSSRESGGSVLGDKTRMTRLSAEPAAFVRPTPTAGVLGGVARKTREAIALCEAAGYDTLFVETVGVGQSEETVASLVDCVLLVLLAGAGDDISSMKRGVLEAADVVAFNKADGGREARVEADASSLRASLHLTRRQAEPPVAVVSALGQAGIAELWQSLRAHVVHLESSGGLAQRRRAQRSDWFASAIDDALRARRLRPEWVALQAELEADVLSGRVSPNEAAAAFIRDFCERTR